jgi:CheY-like chemotaxis protein
VLIVDDVSENREVLSAFLKDLGCQVAAARSGMEAVRLALSRKPDLIFMDVRMPGMDGFETSRQIRARLHRDTTKMIAFSASALTHEQETCLASGFDAFIAKPFRLEAVCELIEQLLPVKFDYVAAGEHPAAALPPNDWSSLSLPPELHEKLNAAADEYRTTELKRGLLELEALGGAVEQQLAQRLRELLQCYDMEAILDILAQIRVGPPGDPAAPQEKEGMDTDHPMRLS